MEGRTIRWDIYEQHWEAATFLWSHWEQALVAPDHVLDDLGPLEERLHMHVDGLVLGGAPVAGRLLHPGLESDDPELIRTAAFPLLLSEVPNGAESVLARVRSATDVELGALQRALEVLEPGQLPTWLRFFPREEDPKLLELELNVLAFHQCAPAASCQALASHPSTKVASAAIRAAGQSRVALAPTVLERALASPCVELRDAALQTGVLGGHRSAWTACRELIQVRSPGSSLPMLLLAIAGEERDLEKLQKLLSEKALWPDVLWALGFSGRIFCADTCLEFMREGTVAAVAGEAFSAITGLPIEGAYATEKTPSEDLEPIPLEQEKFDDDLVPQPVDALPLPRVDAIARWWKETRSHMEPRQRYLGGRPFSPQALLHALASHSMRRRHVLALELALRSRGAQQVPTRAFSEYQRRAMNAVRMAPVYSG